ncbi:MAG: AIR synthase related protein [Clostridium sp.]|nr:AIR synthase related protein [Clostridium sp.]MCM1398643.1 AIR synthase related protein [Clostridium sp.]MCM1459929.1 AIR synthase related protein [Bacteroides sp.]
MEQGTLGELYLTRSVTKHIRKKNKAVVSGAAVGSDYARVRLDGDLVCTEAVAADPFIGWVKAFNNLAVSGAAPVGVRIVLLLPPEISEKEIKDCMNCFNSLAEKANVQILGGHTQVSSAYAVLSVCVQAYGMAGEFCPCRDKIKEGFDIVMAGYAGLMGASLIAKKCSGELAGRFSPDYVADMLTDEEGYSILPAARILEKCNISYMHDVSCGGVYGALWQLGTAIKKGITIDNFKIPIRQETVELCEFYDINPYMLDGTGALLAVTENGPAAVEALGRAGIMSCIIGTVTSGRERVVTVGEDKRFLEPPRGDEIYRVLNIL